MRRCINFSRPLWGLVKPTLNEPYDEVDMSGLELVTKPDDSKAIVIKSVLAEYPERK